MRSPSTIKFVALEAHVGEGSLEPGNRRLQAGWTPLSGLERLLGAAVVQEVLRHIPVKCLQIATGDDLEVLDRYPGRLDRIDRGDDARSPVRGFRVLPSSNATVRTWQPRPQALKTISLVPWPSPEMFALPHDVPGAQLKGD
jgi:hypothetical protein